MAPRAALSMECSWVGRLEGNLRSYAVCFGSFELGASRFVEGRSAAEEVKNEAEVVGEDASKLLRDFEMTCVHAVLVLFGMLLNFLPAR